MQIGWLAAHCVLFDKLRVLIRLYCSFGWGGGAVKNMVQMAKGFGLEVQDQTMELKWVPTAEELKKCFDYGVMIGQKIKA